MRKLWLRMRLKQKFGIYMAMIVLVVAVSAGFSVWLMNYAMNGFHVILDENARCHDFQEAMDKETEAFDSYIREWTEEARDAYVLSCVRSERCLASLPFEYEVIGEERYARTWNVKNSYGEYEKLRDQVLLERQEGGGTVGKLYRVYRMQNYIQTYAARLSQVTLQEGNARYQKQLPVFHRMPALIVLAAGLVTAAAACLTRMLYQMVAGPVVCLARSSRQIAVNDFSGEKLSVPNEDEIGELVYAFNRMKQSTADYIGTMKKNHEMAELLHREEVERIEMERQLNAARLELLKSQINPHFLFNTLNTIGCMAQLEEAKTTERMIRSLSALFRYNLKTTEQFVSLAGELQVVQDYVYIQQMRFGGRIQYDCRLELDPEKAVIPSFSLQPVVENAVIHGLSKKEKGGRLHLRIWMQGDSLILCVADTGVGMGMEELEELKAAMRQRRTAKVGIGLGNIYKRLHLLYRGGELEIFSRRGCGTLVRIIVPQGERGKTEEGKKSKGGNEKI